MVVAIPPVVFDAQRLALLKSFDILDTAPELGFDDIVMLARQLCDTPIALVSLVDANRQWFKAVSGLNVCETPIEQSVCAHSLEQGKTLIIPDLAQDERTRENELVRSAPFIRFYAGSPLVMPSGSAIGTVCVIDTVPRPNGLTPGQVSGLEALGRQVMSQLQLRQAKQDADTANLAKSQFLANMSHELRTPLSAVIGYSEMLEEEVEEMGEHRLLGDLSKIKANARHLLSVINDVLDISKIEANKTEVYAETFDVAEMAEDVASTVGSLMKKKNNGFFVDIAGDLGSMHSDVVKIRQVLINLLSNAAKFTEDGEIRLDARREVGSGGDMMVFTVRDTGLGMSEEQVAKLFQRFTQADVSTTRRFGGTGLGLAITKAFTDMLGGRISISSVPGKGSAFDVAFPVDGTNWTSEAVAGAPSPAHSHGDDLVLVIDDDTATRDLLSRFLSKEGFVVRTAEDGRSGLALAKQLKPRVILLDVAMPRMDGWSVLRSLKENPHLAAIPVVMCTIIDEHNLGFSLGASDYILKPVNWEHLREVLARVHKHATKGDVLVIDDDKDTRSRVRGLLAKNGWTVTEAENGRAALEVLKERAPSVVLLDLNMPEMDGFAFLRQFRTSKDWAAIPVIVMTARDLSAGERAELKGGGARIFEKGKVGMRELVEQLRALDVASSKTASAPAGMPDAATAD